MNILESIFGKFNLSFTWKGNKKKVVKQSGSGIQINQEQPSVTNVYNIQSLSVSNIEQLASINQLTPEGYLQSLTQRFLLEQSMKQDNFRAIVDKAELGQIEDAKDVDKDWFLKWMEVAQGVSKETVQQMLAKILSTEVKTLAKKNSKFFRNFVI